MKKARPKGYVYYISRNNVSGVPVKNLDKKPPEAETNSYETTQKWMKNIPC